MTRFELWAGCGAALFAMGLVALIVVPHPLRRLLALNVMGGGLFLVFIALAQRNADAAGRPDPVPHAMVLTGIVVAVSATGLGIALVRRVQAPAEDADGPGPDGADAADAGADAADAGADAADAGDADASSGPRGPA